MLDLLAAGDLPDDEAAFYLRHIDACAGCRAKCEAALAAHRGVREALAGTIPAHSEAMDVWPSVRERIDSVARRDRLTLEPVRALVLAGALTVGVYLIVGVQDAGRPGGLRPYPVYESGPVIVSAASVDARPARVSGIESGDGETVFLWLE
jgi:anti-sigma factor RsiW